MTWLAPGAFAALALLAGPVIVHLLARRNARRLVFPATHFVRATEAAAVRLRRPSDVGLMILRLAIVAAAVLAAAQPLVMTPWRLARWNARVSRAVVVDTSRSVSDPAAAARLADEALRNVFAGRQVTTADLAGGIDRAVGWLASAAPSRHEIVLVSDFQRGALTEDAVARIPADVGVRFIRAGVQPAARTETSQAVEGWRGGIWQATTAIDAAGTRTSWVRGGDAAAPPWISIAAGPADTAAAERALRAAQSAGVAAGDSARRVLVQFAGAPPLVPAVHPVRSPWIASAARRLRTLAVGSPFSIDIRDPTRPAVISIDFSDVRDPVPATAPSVSVGERDGVMVLTAGVAASAFEAPAIVRAAILAVRPAEIVDAEAEVVTRPDADLARWRREAAPVTATSLNLPGGESDARWLWTLALILLAVEAWLRRPSVRLARRSSGDGGEAHADAA